MGIKKGDTAQLKQPVIEGVVLKRRINPGKDEIEMLLEFTDADDQLHRVWFEADQLEKVEKEPVASEVVDPALLPVESPVGGLK